MYELPDGYYYAKLSLPSFYEIVEVIDNKVYRIGSGEPYDLEDFHTMLTVDFEVPLI